MKNHKWSAVALAASTALVSGASFAQAGGVDVTDATTKIGAAGVAGAAIELATLVMMIGIKVFKWVRGGM